MIATLDGTSHNGRNFSFESDGKKKMNKAFVW